MSTVKTRRYAAPFFQKFSLESGGAAYLREHSEKVP